MSKHWSAFSLALFLCLTASSQEWSRPRVERMQGVWNSLFPTHVVVQNAGNMGLVSVGVGTSHGTRRQFEVQALVGIIPKHLSSRAKITMTFKQTYIPFSVSGTPSVGWQPLRCGAYLNTVFGDEFWANQPDRYPSEYYGGMPTKFRANFFVGTQCTLDMAHLLPALRVRRLTLFCEVSTCDIYLQPDVLHSGINPFEVLTLSLGMEVHP